MISKKEIQNKLASVKKEYNDLVGKMNTKALNDEEVSTEENEKLKTLSNRIKALEDALQRAESVIDEDEDTKAVDEDEDEDRAPAPSGSDKKKAFNIVKGEIGSGLNPKEELGWQAVGNLFARMYGPQDGYKKLCKSMSEKTAKRIMTKATTTTSEPIIPQDMRGYVETLYTNSVIADIAQIEMMPLGQLTLLRESGVITAAYIDEGEDYPYSEADWDRVYLSWKKCAAITSITKEVNQMSPFEIATRVNRQLIKNLSLKADNAFLNNLTTGTNGNQPIGLAGLVTASNKFASSALTSVQTISQDLGKAVNALESNVIDSVGATWIMSPGVKNALKFFANDYQFPFKEELSGDKLFGFNVKTTTQLPTNEGTDAKSSRIYLVQPEFLVIGESGSTEVDQTGYGAFNAGGQTVTPFGSDLISFKATVRHDFNTTQPNAIVELTVDDWSLSNFASLSNSINWTANTAGTTASGAIAKATKSGTSSSGTTASGSTTSTGTSGS